MDDSAKKQQDQQTTGMDNQQAPQVSAPHKEIGPIQASEQEPVLHPEVISAGVEVQTEQPKLTEEHEKIGVKLSSESTPVSTEPSGKVKLPMTDEEMNEALKEGPGNDFDVQKQFEGIYFANAKFFLANLIKKIRKKLKL